MKILSIETSCDETALSILDIVGTFPNVSVTVLANNIYSQVALHAEYGGVFPMLAKREHAKNLVPLLLKTLNDTVTSDAKARPWWELSPDIGEKTVGKRHQGQTLVLQDLEFVREAELREQLLGVLPALKKPDIDAIAVTYGPGLEPALWVGINFSKALSVTWGVPLIPVNHMEGHLFSALLKEDETDSKSEVQNAKQIQSTIYKIQNITFPALTLLISGGHTELVLMKEWLQYEIVGQTRDDAVGEAFDKVARLLGLPYPGGPAISKMAKSYKLEAKSFSFPRPMINSLDFDFSFSGLKTAVYYLLKKTPHITEAFREEVAYEFQEAVAEVLASKTIAAAEKHGAKSILVGGGVSANTRIRETLDRALRSRLESDSSLFLAPRELTGDNALMIGVAAYARHNLKQIEVEQGALVARGNVRLTAHF